MSDFFLYERKSQKPHFILLISDVRRSGDLMAWRVPFTEPFRVAEKRLAIEIAPDEGAIDKPFSDAPGLVESGGLVLNRLSLNKIDFTVSESSGTLMNGNFVLVAPAWGRLTKRKLWVIVKTGKKSQEVFEKE